MIEEILILGALLLGTIADMRTREIPDTLSFSLIGIGFLFASISSLIYASFSPLINSAAGFVAGIILGLLFYFTGMWGGGDAKMIMGIGAVMGFGVFSIGTTLPPFLVFIINTFIVGAIYGACWMTMLGIKHYSSFKKEFSVTMHDEKIKRTRLLLFIFLSVVILISLVAPIYIGFKIATVLVSILFVLFFYLSLVIKSIERSVLFVDIPVNKLTEGDWIVEKIKFKNGKFYKPSKTGISQEDIDLLKKNNIKFARVKEGIPFLPSFLIAYIVTLVFQNWIVLLL